MKEIVVTTQAEFDALPKQFDEYTKIIIKDTRSVRIVIAVLRENASAELRENASAELWGNASAVLRGNASAVLWENASAELWGNASAVLRGNASAELWENASAVLWENALARIFSSTVKVVLHGFAVVFIAATLTATIEKKSDHCHVQITKDLGWFECNAVEKTPIVVLYKRVSKDFKTQEGEPWETTWVIGSTLEHPAWSPAEQECGTGKFHACSRPYFCDEFRTKKGDRYIAISIKIEVLYEWPGNREYPHKIAFRAGTVLYECDKHGKEIKQ